MTLDFGKLDPALLTPLHSGGPVNDHFVEFYSDDPALIDSVGRFFSIGLGRGEAAIVVAEHAHRIALETRLAETIDLEAAIGEGLYQSLDVEEALASFMQNGMPDRAKFERFIGGLIAKAGAGGRQVRVFGEMVAVLWGRGEVAGALSLEDHWNRISDFHEFRLFCAYPTDAFGDKNLAPLRAVCDRHSHVLVSKVPAS